MAKKTLVLELDREADAGYIMLQPIGPGRATTQIMVDDRRLKGYVVLDLDKKGRLLGIELIGYASMLSGGRSGADADD